MDRNTREYQFHVSGFIPGVPGMWPVGAHVTVDEDTKEVLDIWPKPVKPETEQAEQEATPEVPPALDNQPEQEALAQQ